MDETQEHVKISSEPWQLVCCHQVDSPLPVNDESSGVTHRPEEEISSRIRKVLEILYSAQSADHLHINPLFKKNGLMQE